MSDGVFGAVAGIVVEISGIELSDIKLESHLFDDLGIDSLDFLDITYEIDQRFKLRLPVEDWAAEAEGSKEALRTLFTVSNIINFITQESEKAPPTA